MFCSSQLTRLVSYPYIRVDALVNPATALESTVQDFLDACESSPNGAYADLVNCVFRLCGCNSSLDQDIVVDIDGIVDFLSDVVEEIKGVRVLLFHFASCAAIDLSSSLLIVRITRIPPRLQTPHLP